MLRLAKLHIAAEFLQWAHQTVEQRLLQASKGERERKGRLSPRLPLPLARADGKRHKRESLETEPNIRDQGEGRHITISQIHACLVSQRMLAGKGSCLVRAAAACLCRLTASA